MKKTLIVLIATGLLAAGCTNHYGQPIPKTAIGAGTGAVLGTAAGALIGGGTAKGMIIGGVVGGLAGGGTGYYLDERDKERRARYYRQRQQQRYYRNRRPVYY